MAFLLFAACSGPRTPSDQGAESPLLGARVDEVLFVAPTVVDVAAGRLLPVDAVLVRDGRIVSVGAAPADRESVDLVIDARGRYLMPGMVDMHVHHTADGAFPTTDAALYEEADLVLYLAHGVTTVRNMAGLPGDPALVERLARAEVPRPHFVAAGPPIVTGGRDDAVADVETARSLVREQHAAGFDLIKLYCCFGPDRQEMYEALLDEADGLGIPVAGHVPKDLPLERAHRLVSIEHLEHLADMLDEQNLGPLAEAGVFVTPTLVPFASHRLADPATLEAFLASTPAAFISDVLWNAELESIEAGESFLQDAEMQADIEAMFESGRAAVRRLAAAGVPLLVGTDAGGLFPVVPGFSYPDELEHLVAAGLPEEQVLRAATVHAARALGVADHRGAVEVGMDADLVLLDADPLADIAHVRRIVGVMVGGRWLDREELDAAVASRARR